MHTHTHTHTNASINVCMHAAYACMRTCTKVCTHLSGKLRGQLFCRAPVNLVRQDVEVNDDARAALHADKLDSSGIRSVFRWCVGA
jgi:hypothetical protein